MHCKCHSVLLRTSVACIYVFEETLGGCGARSEVCRMKVGCWSLDWFLVYFSATFELLRWTRRLRF